LQKRIALHQAFAQCQIPLPAGSRQSPLAKLMIQDKEEEAKAQAKVMMARQ
jgi:hypothetical protein